MSSSSSTDIDSGVVVSESVTKKRKAEGKILILFLNISGYISLNKTVSRNGKWKSWRGESKSSWKVW